MKVESFSATLNDSGTTTTISLSSGFGTPKAVVFWGGIATTEGSAASNLSFFSGASDGSTHKATTTWAYSGGTHRRKALVSDRCLYIADNTSNAAPSPKAAATAAFSADTITLTHDATPAAAYIVQGVAIGGTCDVAVGYSANTSSDPTVTVTGTPAFMIASQASNPEEAYSSLGTLNTSGGMICNIGITDFTGQVSVQHAGRYVWDTTGGHANTDYILRECNSSNYEAGDQGGYDVSVSGSDVTLNRITLKGTEGWYLIVSNVSEGVAFADVDITGNAAGTAVTGIGFQPDNAIILGFPGSSGTGTTWSTGADTGITAGTFDGTDHDFSYWFSEPSSDTPDSDTYADNAAASIILQSADNTKAANFAIDSFDSDGFTYTVTNYANSSYVGMLLLENEASAPSAPDTTTASATASATTATTGDRVPTSGAAAATASAVDLETDNYSGVAEASASVSDATTGDRSPESATASATASVVDLNTDFLTKPAIATASALSPWTDPSSRVASATASASVATPVSGVPTTSSASATAVANDPTTGQRVPGSSRAQAIASATLAVPNREDPSTLVASATATATTPDVPTGGSLLADWYDTGYGNLAGGGAEVDIFDVVVHDGYLSMSITPTGRNVHSHYDPDTGSSWTTALPLTGRMKRAAGSVGIGVTVLSDFPNSDTYYRLRNYSGSLWQLNAHPDGAETFPDDAFVGPDPTGQWVLFKIEAFDNGAGGTTVRAKVWAEGSSEPASWQLEGTDTGAGRITSGTVGLWADNVGGSAACYWADVAVDIDDGNGSRTLPFEGQGILEVSATANDLTTGGVSTATLTATWTDETGQADVSSSVVWKNSNPLVAGVSGITVAAVSEGYANIFADYNGVESSSILFRVNGGGTPLEVTDASGTFTWQIAEALASSATYWNGDPCVEAPNGRIAVIGITPAPTTDGSGLRYNGSMINPGVNGGPLNAFDQGYTEVISHVGGQAASYVAALDASRPGGAPVSWDNPITVLSEQTLVSTEGRPTGSDSDASVILRVGALTVLSSLPNSPSTKFRPQVYGGAKTHYDIGDLASQTTHIPQWAELSGAPSFAALEPLLEGVWLEVMPDWNNRWFHPSRQMKSYGRDIGARLNAGVLRLLCGANGVQKEALLHRLVQIGVDMDGARQDGFVWDPDGGHNTGRKLVTFLKRKMLSETCEHSTWQAPASPSYGSNGTAVQPFPVFQEDSQTFTVQQTSPGVVNYGDPTYSSQHLPQGDGSYGADQLGMPEFGAKKTEGYWMNPAGAASGFLWGADEIATAISLGSVTDASTSNEYRVAHNFSHQQAFLLVWFWIQQGLTTKNEFAWHPTNGADLDYMDRHMKMSGYEHAANPGIYYRDAGQVTEFGPSDWFSRMWDTYRPSLSEAYWGPYSSDMPAAHVPPDVPEPISGPSVPTTVRAEATATAFDATTDQVQTPESSRATATATVFPATPASRVPSALVAAATASATTAELLWGTPSTAVATAAATATSPTPGSADPVGLSAQAVASANRYGPGGAPTSRVASATASATAATPELVDSVRERVLDAVVAKLNAITPVGYSREAGDWTYRLRLDDFERPNPFLFVSVASEQKRETSHHYDCTLEVEITAFLSTSDGSGDAILDQIVSDIEGVVMANPQWSSTAIDTELEGHERARLEQPRQLVAIVRARISYRHARQNVRSVG